jgi:hypothetical protein
MISTELQDRTIRLQNCRRAEHTEERRGSTREAVNLCLAGHLGPPREVSPEHGWNSFCKWAINSSLLNTQQNNKTTQVAPRHPGSSVR